MHSPLARAIRDARLSARLTQKGLGQHIGLKGRAVYRWECGDSVPRRYIRSSVLRAIRMYSAEAATKLSAAFEDHDARKKGLVSAAPAPVAAARPRNPVALDLAMFAMAEELDLAPRRLRAALLTLFARIAEAGYSLESAQSDVASRAAGVKDMEPPRAAS